MSNYFENHIGGDPAVAELKQLVDNIANWLDINGYMDDHLSERFVRIDDILSSSGRNLLFLAEFSRGKSELINTIFFGSTGRRLLPSAPGRTTQCATVLQYDEGERTGVKLLPTLGPPETYRQTITDLTENAALWEQTVFPAQDPDSIAAALQQIADTELVDLAVARELGFASSVGEDDLAKIDVVDGKVAIPKYRHAIFNYPHPLLEQGLEIVDTPGLNALGVEPELTLYSLDRASAIVFVVSVDTGITRSELDIWTQYVKPRHINNVLVVINKIDMLWDSIKSRQEIDTLVTKQVNDVSRILEIPRNRIFPLSAQKALVARRDKNRQMEQASRIDAFEQALADSLHYTDGSELITQAHAEIIPIMSTSTKTIAHRAQTTLKQIKEIQATAGANERNHDEHAKMVQEKREGLELATREINLFRVELKMNYADFVKKLDVFTLDKLIVRYRMETSKGAASAELQQDMLEFERQTVNKFKAAMGCIDVLKQKLEALYERVQKLIETRGLVPHDIHLDVYLDILHKHHEENGYYQDGKLKEVDENSVVRDRYSILAILRVRKLYIQARDEVERWRQNALIPLELEMRERMSSQRKQLLSLQRIRNQDSGLTDELKVLQSRMQGHQQRLNTIKDFHGQLKKIVASATEREDSSNVINLEARRSVG